MTSEDFKEQIRKHFAYLFASYGFEITYETSLYEPRDKMLVGLESDSIRVAVDKSLGAATALIGTNDADFRKTTATGSERQWFNVERIAAYIEKHTFEWGEPQSSETIDDMLSIAARRLEPVMDKVLEMFHSADSLDRWEADYKAYAAEQFELRYGKD